MTDRPETQRSFEAPPTSLGARRRDHVPVLVAIAVVAFIVVAVAKPWGTGDPATTVVDASLAASTPGTSNVPGTPSTPSAGPASGLVAALRTPDVDGRAPRPAESAGDPVTAAAPLVKKISAHAGAWGIGAGGWDVGSAGRLDWMSWRQTTPMRWDDPAVLLGYIDRERVCETDHHLPGRAAVLAVTSPPGIRPDWIVKGWVVAQDGTTVVAPKVRRITLSSSVGVVSALAFADGSSWADGVYRLLVQDRGNRLAIDVCLGSGGPRTGRATASTPTDGIIRTITAGLVGRSGEWGVGTGGDDSIAGHNGTGTSDGTSHGAWVAWRAATPVAEDRSIGIRPPPSCPASQDGSTQLRSGIVLALTVPAGLPPDWTAEAVRFDGRGRATVDAATRQVTPPGNRGIAYLIRSDGSAWPPGAYRFRITTSTRSVRIDACLAAS